MLGLSGDDTRERREEALRRGAVDFLQKPFPLSEVFARVQTLVHDPEFTTPDSSPPASSRDHQCGQPCLEPSWVLETPTSAPGTLTASNHLKAQIEVLSRSKAIVSAFLALSHATAANRCLGNQGSCCWSISSREAFGLSFWNPPCSSQESSRS